jgi:hypothetical protein
MKIHNIEKSQFNEIDIARQIIFDEDRCRYALIDLGKEFGCYGLSWRSDLIEPIITSVHKQIWIGIDQRLTAINLNTGHIIVSLPLITNILQIEVANAATVVLTESELLIFNQDGSIRYIKGLPELASKMIIRDCEVKIYGIEGDIWIVDTQTGVFKQSPVAA